MYIKTSLKYHRITGAQSHAISKVHDLLGQPSYCCDWQFKVPSLKPCHIFMLLIICFRFASAKKDGSNYFVLLIITDGVITDMPQTIMSIVNVSYLQWFVYQMYYVSVIDSFR